MTIPASRRDEMRRLAVAMRERNRSINLGGPRYSCVVGSDELLALVRAVPDLLDEIDRLEADLAADGTRLTDRQAQIEQIANELTARLREVAEQQLVIEQQGRDLEKLRAALDEALTMWGDETGVHTLGMDDNYDRLRKVLG